MKHVAEPDTLLLWDGELMRVNSIGEGRTITLMPIDAKSCNHCGEVRTVTVLEHSPLFQSKAEAVATLTTR